MGAEAEMQYALLGSTGLVVSRMAFGAMTFTQGNKNVAAIYKVGAALAGELVGKAMPASTSSTPPTATPAASPRPCSGWNSRPRSWLRIPDLVHRAAGRRGAAEGARVTV
jgi:hypothetical protein